MSLFKKNIISNQVVKAKSDRLMRRAMRHSKKQIRKGIIIDSESLTMHLTDIDDKYTRIKADINNATIVNNYADVCAAKQADTLQKLAAYSPGYAKLNRLSQATDKKAKDAGRPDDFIHEELSALDITKLQNEFDDLIREENENDKTEK